MVILSSKQKFWKLAHGYQLMTQTLKALLKPFKLGIKRDQRPPHVTPLNAPTEVVTNGRQV